MSANTMSSSRFSTRPLYLQLRDALVQRIAAGEWKPGTAIPNESDLAREFGVSSGTMRKALDMLEAERLLTRRQGRGTFVNDPASDELAVRFSNVRGPGGERVSGDVRATEVEEAAANEVECVRLRLRRQDRVLRLKRVRYMGEKPIMVEHASLPAALFPGFVGKEGVSHRIVLLAQQYGILLGKAEERVSIGTASPAVAEALGIEPDAPLLLLDRVVHTLDGRPIEWRVAHCHLADQYYLAEMT